MKIEIPKGWESRRLEEVVQIDTGFAFKSADFLDSGGTPIVRMSNLSNGRLNLLAAARVPSSITAPLSKFQLRCGDFLIGLSGSLTNYAWVTKDDPDCYLNQRVGRLRANDPATALFASYWYLSSPTQQQIEADAAGAAQLNISPRQLGAFRMSLPPLPEQRKIAAILSSVDEAIQATQAVIEQTRRVKEGLLQELLTKGIGHTRFKQTPIGEIPEGWEVLRIIDVLKGKPRNGYSPKTSEKGIPTFSIAAVRDGDIDIVGNLKYTIASVEDAAPYRVISGDILLVRGNANPKFLGAAGRVGLYPDGCIYPDLLMRLTPLEKIDPVFMLLSINSRTVHDQLLRKAKTTNGTLKVNGQDVSSTLLAVPGVAEQKSIVEMVSAVSKTIELCSEELTSLCQIKSGLLQDLLTGKVRVSP